VKAVCRPSAHWGLRLGAHVDQTGALSVSGRLRCRARRGASRTGCEVTPPRSAPDSMIGQGPHHGLLGPHGRDASTSAGSLVPRQSPTRYLHPDEQACTLAATGK
jgi:hypothetical protein